jgi:hypothetical protein
MGAGIADIPGVPVDFRQQDSIGSGAREQADGRSHIGREWKQFQGFPLGSAVRHTDWPDCGHRSAMKRPDLGEGGRICATNSPDAAVMN